MGKEASVAVAMKGQIAHLKIHTAFQADGEGPDQVRGLVPVPFGSLLSCAAVRRRPPFAPAGEALHRAGTAPSGRPAYPRPPRYGPLPCPAARCGPRCGTARSRRTRRPHPAHPAAPAGAGGTGDAGRNNPPRSRPAGIFLVFEQMCPNRGQAPATPAFIAIAGIVVVQYQVPDAAGPSSTRVQAESLGMPWVSREKESPAPGLPGCTT